MRTALLTWLLTYAVHGTVLLGLVWLLGRLGRPRSLAVREWLWRGALVAGLASASVQTFAGVRPWSGALALPEGVRATLAQTVVPAPPAPGPVELVARPAPAVARSASSSDGTLPAPPASLRGRGPVAAPARPGAARLPALAGLLVGLWWTLLALRARRALGRRRPLTAGPWADALEELLRASGLRRRVRLTVSGRIQVPVALGLLRPEICLGERVLRDLDPALARAVLAHELAHLARLDPLWLGLGHVLRTLFFFQPLHHLAVRELVRLSELRADAWAVRRTGDRLALARSLTEVATWLHPRRAPALPPAACAMARRAGRLEERVRRLLDATPEDEARSPGPPRARLAGALGLAVLAPLALPGWSLDPPGAGAADPAAAPPPGWSAAAEAAGALERALDRLDGRLAGVPDDPEGRRQALLARSATLRAAVHRVRAQAEAGARAARPREPTTNNPTTRKPDRGPTR